MFIYIPCLTVFPKDAWDENIIRNPVKYTMFTCLMYTNVFYFIFIYTYVFKEFPAAYIHICGVNVLYLVDTNHFPKYNLTC